MLRRIALKRQCLRLRNTQPTPCLARQYVKPTSARLEPATAEALATRDDDYHPIYTAGEGSASRLGRDNDRHRLSGGGIDLPPFSTQMLTVLPPPLPEDVPATPINLESFPSTSLLDALSLISICLTRSETIPRAFDIFSSLLIEHGSNKSILPEADVFAAVITGCFNMVTEKKNGRKSQPAEESIKLWMNRAEALIVNWEEFNGGRGRQDPQSSRPKPAGLRQGGEKVYQAYLGGLMASSSSLAPVIPYFHSQALSPLKWVENLTSAGRLAAYDQLIEAAKKEGDEEVAQILESAKGVQQEQDRIAQTKTPEEITPIMAQGPVTPALREQTTDIPEGPLPRFAITNLRHTFRGVPRNELPFRRQEILESASLAAARAELIHASQVLEEKELTDVQAGQKLQSGKLQAWMWEWTQMLQDRLKTDLDQLEKGVDKGVRTIRLAWKKGNGVTEEDLLLYLRLLPADKLALVTILETMRSCGGGGIVDGLKTLRGMIQVGKAVETEYRATTIRSMLGKKHAETLLNPSGEVVADGTRAINALWKKVGQPKGADMDKIFVRAGMEENKIRSGLEALRKVWTPDWTQFKHVSVGAFLLNALVDTAKVTRTMRDKNGEEHSEIQPAFSHGYEYVRGNKLGVIKLNPAVASRLARDNIGIVVHPKHMPMLIPPRMWKGYDDGAYLMHKVNIMRFKESAEQTSYLKAASEAGKIDRVYKGLDVLSSTPWQINRKVFDTVLTCWNKGEAIADIPASEENSNYEVPEKVDADSWDPSQRVKYVLAVKQMQTQMRKDHSERCKFNYNLELARGFINDTFYIPHNLDFRGRAYPIPPHLNPVGDDLSRGLLQFGEKKPLGPTGLRWLRIHLANVYGYDKASFTDREKFAIDHEQDILDSADKPLEGSRWWLKAEDPWQCLAACNEIAQAIRMPNPEEFLTSLPVHQDGTCNGMQHYAALGGDVQGAQAVNLVGGEKPADVYTRIADLVNEIVDRDAGTGHTFANVVKGKITRKVVKQTVMTTVYGVTFVGAKDQIAKQLLAKGEIPRELIYHVSGYIARTVLGCIGDLFSGATAIQDWLTVCARLISRSFPFGRASDAVRPVTKDSRGKEVMKDYAGRPVLRADGNKENMTSVIWTSPLGLPVVQPYRKVARKQMVFTLQSVYLSDPNAVSEVAPGKQASAMPPNFIHSLDATHMLMCASKCREEDITFASVHDSYWTHAGSVHGLSRNIRDTFVELHKRDIVGDLRKEFMQRYDDHLIPLTAAIGVLFNSAKRGESRQLAKVEKELTAEAVAADGGETDLNPISVEEMEDASPIKRNKAYYEKLLCHADGTPFERIVVGKRQFLRLKDVLPFAPKRGGFDVQRVRESDYFFS